MPYRAFCAEVVQDVVDEEWAATGYFWDGGRYLHQFFSRSLLTALGENVTIFTIKLYFGEKAMRIHLFILLFVLSLLLAACGGASQAEPTPIPTVPAAYAGKTMPASADASAGKEVFTVNCESCHGPQGHGDGPAAASLDPKPRNLPQFVQLVGDDYLFWRVSEGVPGTSMVAWSNVLSEEDIWNVIAYVRTLK